MLSLTTQGTLLALQLLVRTLSFQTQCYRDESSKRTTINDTNASFVQKIYVIVREWTRDSHSEVGDRPKKR